LNAINESSVHIGATKKINEPTESKPYDVSELSEKMHKGNSKDFYFISLFSYFDINLNLY